MSRLRLLKVQVILGTDDNVILWMSNEAHFHLNETVNKQNLSYWAPEHPHLIHLHSEKEVTIWCVIGIIGPNFF